VIKAAIGEDSQSDDDDQEENAEARQDNCGGEGDGD
jgi:hypothetical protein